MQTVITKAYATLTMEHVYVNLDGTIKVIAQVLIGGFQLVDLIIRELKNHIICYNSMLLIG
jgi:hypothetical protein